jgi:hypothetical protein
MKTWAALRFTRGFPLKEPKYNSYSIVLLAYCRIGKGDKGGKGGGGNKHYYYYYDYYY